MASLEEAAAANPEGPAISCLHQEPGHLKSLIASRDHDSISLKWNFSDLRTAALRMALALRTHDCKSGSVIATLLDNGIEWAIMHWASRLLKCTFVPLDGRGLDVLESVLQKLRPAAMICDSQAHAERAEQLLKASGVPCIKICTKNLPTMPGWNDFKKFALSILLDTAKIELLLQEANNDDPERIDGVAFSSGTTGSPKACPRLVRQSLEIIQRTKASYPPGLRVQFLVYGPNCSFTSQFLTLVAWAFGSSITVPSRKFDIKAGLDAIDGGHAQFILLSPMVLEGMIRHPSFSQRSTTSVFMVAMTYDVITKRTVRKAAEAFPSARVICGHGMTEGGSNIFQWPRDVPGPLHGPYWQGIASIGKINTGFGVKVVGCDGQILQKGQIGELHLSGSSFTTSYLDSRCQDTFYTDDEQRTWTRTGDAGVMDDNDFVYILGRQSDMIRRQDGLMIPPASIEDCLAEFLDCQVVVLRVYGGHNGQAPFAVVSRLGEKTKGDVEEHVLNLFGSTHRLAGVATLADLGLNTFQTDSVVKVKKADFVEPVARYRDLRH